MEPFVAKVETLGGLSRALTDAAREANNLIQSGPVVVEVRPGSRKRTADQNAKIHAMLADIAEQVELRGCKHNAHVWKRLTTAEWLKESGERPMIIQDISGEIVVLWEKTSKLSTKQMAEYVEWLYSFGAQQGVKWKGKAA